MKLSEQYEHRINKVNELDTVSKVAPVPDGSTPAGLAPSFSAWDIHSYITYGTIAAGILTLIFGKTYLRKMIGINTKLDKPGLIARMRDKKALKAAKLSDSEIRDMWIRGEHAIGELDRATISSAIKRVKNGTLTAKQAMVELGELYPRGNKAANYAKFKKFENNAIAKKAAKPITKIEYPNITPEQYEKLGIQQRAVLKNNPTFTVAQINTYSNK